MSFQPFINYAGYQHVLQAGAHWTHPNGNTYACACEQLDGAKQNLSVYRMRQGAASWELVRRYRGTVDSQAHITMGAASIEPSGALLVSTSLIPVGVPYVTRTGFQGVWIREANVDDPYPADLALRMKQVETEINRLQGIASEQQRLIEGISGGAGLSAEDREALDRLRAMLRI